MKVFPILVLVAVSHAAGIVVALPQNPATDVTRVNVMVQNNRGACVTGLGADDFEVVADDRPRPIELFSAEPQAVTAVVLVDITASMPGGAMRMPAFGMLPGEVNVRPRAVEEFALKGVGKGDRIRVGAVRRRLWISPGFTSEPREYTKQWHEMFNVPVLEFLGPSPIWDGLSEATRLLQHEPGQRAVAILSDGRATGNTQSWRNVAEQAALAGVSISVMLDDSERMGPELEPEASLRAIADATGGVRALPPQGVRVAANLDLYRSEQLSQIFSCLHGAYVLGFRAASSTAGPRPLTVRARRPDLIVRARGMYSAGQAGRD